MNFFQTAKVRNNFEIAEKRMVLFWGKGKEAILGIVKKLSQELK